MPTPPRASTSPPRSLTSSAARATEPSNVRHPEARSPSAEPELGGLRGLAVRRKRPLSAHSKSLSISEGQPSTETQPTQPSPISKRPRVEPPSRPSSPGSAVFGALSAAAAVPQHAERASQFTVSRADFEAINELPAHQQVSATKRLMLNCIGSQAGITEATVKEIIGLVKQVNKHEDIWDPAGMLQLLSELSKMVQKFESAHGPQASSAIQEGLKKLNKAVAQAYGFKVNAVQQVSVPIGEAQRLLSTEHVTSPFQIRFPHGLLYVEKSTVDDNGVLWHEATFRPATSRKITDSDFSDFRPMQQFIDPTGLAHQRTEFEEVGVNDSPIEIAATPDGGLCIRDGHHRLAAGMLADMPINMSIDPREETNLAYPDWSVVSERPPGEDDAK